MSGAVTYKTFSVTYWTRTSGWKFVDNKTDTEWIQFKPNGFLDWQKEYWDILYKRGTYVEDLRERNLRQAARIMDLELKLRISNRLVEEFRPREGLEASKYWDVK